MPYSTLLLTTDDRATTITLNRPEKRNAISYELIDELLAALDEVESSGAAVLIITGAGKAFCSGMDLDNLKLVTRRSAEDNLKDSETVARLLRRIYEFPRPVIAAVNGPAIAGGCGIATVCDFTLASTEAKFGYSEVKIGFIPAIVSSFLLRQVGEKHARDLMLTGRTIDAAEAHRMGLVNEVTSAEELLPRARALAALLVENSPASIAGTKRLLADYARLQFETELKMGIEANSKIRTTDDFREGITSFLEKRKPHWTGK